MIPGNTFTSTPITGDYLPPVSDTYTPLLETVYGGVNIGDPSRGRLYRLWTISYDGTHINVAKQGLAPSLILPVAGVKSVSLSFDSNMGVVIAYQTNAGGTLYYYDTLTNAYIYRSFPSTNTSRVAVDQAAPFYNANSDVIYAYTNGTNLCYRQQRDRYNIEYIVGPVYANSILTRVALSSVNRLQFELLNGIPTPNIAATLSDIIATSEMYSTNGSYSISISDGAVLSDNYTYPTGSSTYSVSVSDAYSSSEIYGSITTYDNVLSDTTVTSESYTGTDISGSGTVSVIGTSYSINATSLSVPSGSAAGDMLLLVQTDGRTTNPIPTPTGFTTVYNPSYGTLCYRIMQAGDSSFSTVGAEFMAIVALRSSTGNITFDTGGLSSAPTTTTAVTNSPTVTPALPPVMAVMFIMCRNGGLTSPDTTYTPLFAPTQTGINTCGLGIWTTPLTTSTPFVGTYATTSSTSTYTGGSMTVLIRAY